MIQVETLTDEGDRRGPARRRVTVREVVLEVSSTARLHAEAVDVSVAFTSSAAPREELGKRVILFRHVNRQRQCEMVEEEKC